jgi:C4-type Zn-finger protein
MKFTDEQKYLLSQKLNYPEKCPNCGESGKCKIDMSAYTLPSFHRHEGNIIVGDEVGTMVAAAVICEECSYTRFFNLKTLGVVTK